MLWLAVVTSHFFVQRLLSLLFSFCVHAAIVGGVFFFGGHGSEKVEQERVYRVLLAELAPPQAPVVEVATPPSLPVPPPDPPREEPEVKEVAPPPEKKVVPREVVKPKVKKISRKKKKQKKEPARKDVLPKQQAVPSQTLVKSEVSSSDVVPQRGLGSPRRAGGSVVYEPDRVDQRPAIARSVTPKFPFKAKRMGIEGDVKVQLVVDTAGHPRNCSILSAVPPGYFEDAALSAAGQMQFIPGKIQGRPVNTRVVLPFAFRLQ